MGEWRVLRHSVAASRAQICLWALVAAVSVALGGQPQASAGADSVTAAVDNGALRVTGTSGADKITLRRDTGNLLAVDIGNDGSADFTFDRNSFTRILVNAGSGDDLVRIDERNGAFTDTEVTTIDGRGGVDLLRGGSFAERFKGGSGNDTIQAGKGNDVVSTGTGNDSALLGRGADSLVWSRREGVDVIQGGAGTDKVVVNGSAAADSIEVARNLNRVNVVSGGVLLDVDAVEQITVNAGAGADSLIVGRLAPEPTSVQLNLGGGAEQGDGDGSADSVTIEGTAGPDVMNVTSGPQAGELLVTGPGDINIVEAEWESDTLTLIGLGDADTFTSGATALFVKKLTLNGGDGSDSLTGGDGDDTLIGGGGADLVDGNQGKDVVLMGDGNDTFFWEPDAAGDVVEGGTDLDTLRYDGGSGTDSFRASASNVRLQLTRISNGALFIDGNDVERLVFNGYGGPDDVIVDDLSKTDVETIEMNLGHEDFADLDADSVHVNGTGSNDSIVATGSGDTVSISGLATSISISNTSAEDDLLTINGLAFDDTIDTSGLDGFIKEVQLDGGEGNDVLIGMNGNDTLFGGDGDDVIDGNAGLDKTWMGAGEDTFTWNPGDGDDAWVEGGEGSTDKAIFNGSDAAESFSALSPFGGRVELTRDIGNIGVWVGTTETLVVNALGGADSMMTNILARSDVDSLVLSLGVGGVGDAQADSVVVNTGNQPDPVSLSGGAGAVTLSYPAATIVLDDAEPANDTLTVNTGGGADVVSASGLASTSVVLTVNAGAGNDIVVGSSGNDFINGDAGDDDLRGGPGNDTLNGGTETDYIDGGSGSDTATNGETVVNVP